MEKLFNFRDMVWEHPTAFDPGIDQVVLVNTLDEQNKTGVRTRFVRFGSGAQTKVPFVHDYHEEVYIVEGEQALLDKDSFKLLINHQQGTYFIRPAGTYHGPFLSEKGCILLELHYYGELKDHSIKVGQ